MTQIRTEDPVYGGYVISRADGIVFVKGAMPGEVVEVTVEEKRKDYTLASVVEVIEPSPDRMEPACPAFGKCGGCHLQFALYSRQVTMKNEVLLDCLKRIGGMTPELGGALYGPDLGYRHRAQFKVSKEGAIGFYAEGTRNVVPIESCPLMVDRINAGLKGLRAIDLSGVREVHVTAGDGMVALVKGIAYNEELADRIMGAGFTGVAFEDDRYRGTGPAYVTFDLNGLKYTVSPWSFFQSNWELNRRLERLIAEELGDLSGMRVLDLYAGGGNFSLSLGVSAKLAVAVEENRHATTDGERNASVNRVSNYRYVKGSAENAKLQGRFDVVLLDPPRPGLSKLAMEKVMGIMPARIAYVSCNPSTFARDLRKLVEFYDIASIRMVDFFPHTYHVESVAFLNRKSAGPAA